MTASARGARRLPACGTVEIDLRDARLAGAGMLAAAFVLPVLHTGGLPCPLRTLTGVPCPLCGMTTSVIASVHLHLGDALAANPAGIAAVVAALLLVLRRPERMRMAAPAPALILGATWLFELHRFGYL